MNFSIKNATTIDTETQVQNVTNIKDGMIEPLSLISVLVANKLYYITCLNFISHYPGVGVKKSYKHAQYIVGNRTMCRIQISKLTFSK